jgi:hypothetical protein
VLPDATEANNVVIEDEAKAQQWVAESYALDHALGLLTHTLGETGARPRRRCGSESGTWSPLTRQRRA